MCRIRFDGSQRWWRIASWSAWMRWIWALAVLSAKEPTMIDFATFSGRWRTSWWRQHASDVHLDVFGSRNRQGTDHSLKSVVDAAYGLTNKLKSVLIAESTFCGWGLFWEAHQGHAWQLQRHCRPNYDAKSLTNQTLGLTTPHLWNPVDKQFHWGKFSMWSFWSPTFQQTSLRDTHFSYQIFLENHHKQQLKTRKDKILRMISNELP